MKVAIGISSVRSRDVRDSGASSASNQARAVAARAARRSRAPGPPTDGPGTSATSPRPRPRPRPRRVLAGGGGRSAHRGVGHRGDQFVLAGDVAVEGHRGAAQFLGDPLHRQRGQPLVVGDGHRDADDHVGGQPGTDPLSRAWRATSRSAVASRSLITSFSRLSAKLDLQHIGGGADGCLTVSGSLGPLECRSGPVPGGEEPRAARHAAAAGGPARHDRPARRAVVERRAAGATPGGWCRPTSSGCAGGSGTGPRSTRAAAAT